VLSPAHAGTAPNDDDPLLGKGHTMPPGCDDYENVTVTQIAGRPWLTRRTFSRYFRDKRDVLLAGSERLPPALAEAHLATDPELSPFDALLTALAEVGAQLAHRVAPHAVQRRAVIAGAPNCRSGAEPSSPRSPMHSRPPCASAAWKP
jgi:hypothetical protein